MIAARKWTENTVKNNPPLSQPILARLPHGLDTSAAKTHKLEAISRQLLETSILLVFFVAPWFLGGRHPIGEFALIIAVLPGVAGIVIRSLGGGTLNLSPSAIWILLVASLIPLIQIVPLPASWIQDISPGLEKLFLSQNLLGSLNAATDTISISPAATIKAYPLLIAYIAIFVILASRIETLADITWLIKIVVCSAGLLALTALLQAKFDNGRFLWLYEHPTRETGNIPRGPFQNENHLASLLATTFPALLYLLHQSTSVARNCTEANSRKYKRPKISSGTTFSTTGTLQISPQLWIFASIAVIFFITVYATPSRGGAAMLALSVSAWLAIIGWNKLGKRFASNINRIYWLVSGGFVLGITMLAATPMILRFVKQSSYWRWKVWNADFSIWRDFPVFGVGIGNRRYLYHAYMDEYFHQTFSYSESSWLQTLVETGCVGFTLNVLIAASVCFACLHTIGKAKESNTFVLACSLLAGLAISCLHAAGDFPWHIPTCFVTVLALAFLATRLSALTNVSTTNGRSQNYQLPAFISTILATLLLLGTAWSIVQATPTALASLSWDNYRRLVRQTEGNENDQLSEAAVAALKETLRRDPNHLLARTALLYGKTLEFENQKFQLADIDTTSKQVLLECHRLAYLCPAESRVYFCAALAASMQNASIEQQQRYLLQAHRLRPTSGLVALKLGINYLLMQEMDNANSHFSLAINSDASFRKHAIQMIEPIFGAKRILDDFHPNHDALGALYQHLRSKNSDDMAVIGTKFCESLLLNAQKSDSPFAKDKILSTAQEISRQIASPPLQLQILEARLKEAPNRADLLLDRATMLVQQGRIMEAKIDVQKSLELSPDSIKAKELAIALDRQALTIR